jgi:hypothetical protein
VGSWRLVRYVDTPDGGTLTISESYMVGTQRVRAERVLQRDAKSHK